MTLYLDNNATTPIDPRVLDEMVRCYRENYGNAGSPHVFGERAKAAVQQARDRVAAVVAARRHEVIFTSGATESNNLALLGLAAHGAATGKRHLVSTQIEHRAVLEPLAELKKRGFEVTLIAPHRGGAVAAQDVLNAIRADTLAVSVMHVNNETGVRQPIAEIAEAMPHAETLLHVDAAQGFGKEPDALRHQRIDLISVSGHKLHGPQGIGALVARRRNGCLPPLRPLTFGGGQELELRRARCRSVDRRPRVGRGTGQPGKRGPRRALPATKTDFARATRRAPAHRPRGPESSRAPHVECVIPRTRRGAGHSSVVAGRGDFRWLGLHLSLRDGEPRALGDGRRLLGIRRRGSPVMELHDVS